MPNFDMAGPLKRRRAIGLGLGPCKPCTESCMKKAEDRETPVNNEITEE
jgi:hypothetical protein